MKKRGHRLKLVGVVAATLLLLLSGFGGVESAHACRLWTYADGMICEISPVTGVEIFSWLTGDASPAIHPGMAFDGTNVLYTNEQLDVIKVFATDGTLLGTIGKVGSGTDTGAAGLGATTSEIFAVGSSAPDAGVIRRGSLSDGVETSNCELSGATQGLTYAGTRGTIFVSAGTVDEPEIIEANPNCTDARTMQVSIQFRGLCYSTDDEALYAVKTGLLYKLDPDTGAVASGYPLQITAKSDGHAVLKAGACAAGKAVSSTCGDGVVDGAAGETCDPPGSTQFLGTICRDDCTFCGDGNIDPGEECDNCPHSDTQPDTCRTNCMLPSCGDGVIDTGEQCDGEATGSCPGACGSDCNCAPTCGDGVVDGAAGETCDPPGSTQFLGTICRDDCTFCGDGNIDPGEECDNCPHSDTQPDTCRTNCMLPSCGDGVIDTGEQCDGEATGSCPGACGSDCNCAPTCGDGVIDDGEECDGAATGSCVGACTGECTCAPGCGDGVIDDGEECDGAATGSCVGSCTSECTCAPACGDGNVDDGEECDNGPQNSDSLADACRTDCSQAGCGDDVVDTGEQCDGSAVGFCLGSCNPDCTCGPACGDGNVDDGEECDNGSQNSDTTPNACRTNCMNPYCGDGVTDDGEECDPAQKELCNNMLDDDGDGLIDCLDPDCQPITEPTCGGECMVIPPCGLIRKDPAIIRFAREGQVLDYLQLHGRYPLLSDIDPPVDGFGVLLTNANGVIYEGSLGSGMLRRRTGGKGRYYFKDRGARRGVPSADGIYKVVVHRRLVHGEPYLAFRVKAYGDFSAATMALMSTQVLVGDDVAILSAEWQQTNRGWILRQSDFELEPTP